MKLIHSVLIIALAGGTLWAQATPDSNKPVAPKVATKTPVTAATKPAPVAKAVAPAVAPAKANTNSAPVSAVAKSTAPVATKKSAPKPATNAKPAVAASAVKSTPTPVAKLAAVKEETTRVSPKERDPFVSPVVRTGGNVGSGCDTGKKCLVVDQIILKGIVKSPSGFIAVVENPARRAYFMRENDPVFNGKIVRITGDAVVFQEEVMDKLGKQSTREVVKKVNAPAV
jgi:Tfp pilus assembly protein PilP